MSDKHRQPHTDGSAPILTLLELPSIIFPLSRDGHQWPKNPCSLLKMRPGPNFKAISTYNKTNKHLLNKKTGLHAFFPKTGSHPVRLVFLPQRPFSAVIFGPVSPLIHTSVQIPIIWIAFQRFVSNNINIPQSSNNLHNLIEAKVGRFPKDVGCNQGNLRLYPFRCNLAPQPTKADIKVFTP